MWWYLVFVAYAGGVPAIPDKTLTPLTPSLAQASTPLRFTSPPTAQVVMARPPLLPQEGVPYQGVMVFAHTGGVGSVKVTFDAGAHTALFQDMASAPAPKPSSGLTIAAPTLVKGLPAPVVNPAIRDALVAGGSATPLGPATPGTRKIRFVGLPQGAANPSKIPLTVTLTDGAGTVVRHTVEVRVELPTITSLTATSHGFGVTPGVAVDLEVAATGMEHVYEARLTGVACGQELAVDHGFTKPTGSTWRGKVTTVVEGRTCSSPAMGVEIRRAAGGPLESQAFRQSGTLTIANVVDPVRTVVQDTYGFFEAQGMGPAGGTGTCSGDSSAIGGGVFPVGFREKDRDASFEIRSGPIGTSCQYKDTQAFPPQLDGREDGLRLVALTVAIDGTERCREDVAKDLAGAAINVAVGGSLTGGATLALGRLDFMRGIAVNDDADEGRFVFTPREGPGDEVIEGVEHAWGPGPSGADWVVEDPHFSFSLDCDPTATNDHWGRITVTSLEFEHPPGVVIPGR